jgi:hypothetical protein
MIGAMETDSRITAKPSLDGLVNKWTRAWEMGRVVQV